MSSFSKEEIIETIKPTLKSAGFKKTRTNWHKEVEETIMVFNIQGSQWGTEFYIDLGIYLKTLGNEVTPPVYRCHIQRRIEHEKYNHINEIVSDSIVWFSEHCSIEKIKQLWKTNQLPLMTFIEVHRYLEALSVSE